jgi:predicted dehydrogenase
MIQAAILGLGWWGKTIIRRMATSDRLRIVTAVDVNPEPHREFVKDFGIRLTTSYDEVLDDPGIDAVILATPNSLHVRQVVAAAGKGKHVFCEKPLALSRADAVRCVEACRAAGVMLGIGHERRYEPAMMEVERLVRDGALGTIMHAEANFSHDKLVDVPQTDWRRSAKESPAAGMTAMGIHLTDAFINLFGNVESVFASTANRVLKSENGDVVSVLLKFASGATAYLNATLVTPIYLRFTVFGSDAWVEVRNETHPDTVGSATLTLQPAKGEPQVRVYDWADSVRANLETFAEAVHGRAPYPITDEQKIENIAVLEAVSRSAETGNAVAVERSA